MSAVTFSRIAGIVFLIVALAHLSRAVSGAPIQLGTVLVPLWVSWVAVLGAGGLGLLGIRARAS